MNIFGCFLSTPGVIFSDVARALFVRVGFFQRLVCTHLILFELPTDRSMYIQAMYKTDSHQNLVAIRMYRSAAHPVTPPSTTR